MTIQPIKKVDKPWGYEEWLELNGSYCFKKLFIKEGHRTSLQYHHKKVETLYFVKGKAEVWIGPDDENFEKKEFGPGDSLTIKPETRHRVVAISDITYLESSSPEVEDLVRVSDDYKR